MVKTMFKIGAIFFGIIAACAIYYVGATPATYHPKTCFVLTVIGALSLVVSHLASYHSGRGRPTNAGSIKGHHTYAVRARFAQEGKDEGVMVITGIGALKDEFLLVKCNLKEIPRDTDNVLVKEGEIVPL